MLKRIAMNFHSLTVSKIERFNTDSIAISLTIPADLKSTFRFEPGQYITFSHSLGDKEIRRSYSIASVPKDEMITVGVKEVSGGIFSTYANKTLKEGDVILKIDNNEVQSIMDVSKYIMMSTDDIIDFKVKRSYDEIILNIKPDLVEGEDNLGNKINKRMVGIKLGAYNDQVNHVKLGPAQSILHAFNEVYYVSVSSLKYIGGMIVGKADTSQLGGPIRIAKISGQVADIGLLAFISMMAYISISLGLVNLFPIPMLDGGHLMFYAFEKVLGRPLSQKTQEGFFRIGMFLLISLMFFTTFNDLKDLGLFR